MDTSRKHPVCHDLVRRYLRGVGVCVCVCVCEPKPECQKDQRRGDKREECRLGLIRALLSGLRFLSITESGTKGRDRGIWLEFQRALASAALSSLGLVCWFCLFFPPSPNCKVCICDQTEERRETFFVNQNNIIFLLQLLFHRGRHRLGEIREILMRRKKIIGNERIKKAKSQL